MPLIVGVVAIRDGTKEGLEMLQGKIHVLLVQCTSHIAHGIVGGDGISCHIIRNESLGES